MNYAVIDLETTITEKFKRKGNPWFNKIVAIGCKYFNESLPSSMYYTDCSFDSSTIFRPEISILIGHNIKYDLLYLWKNSDLKEFFKKGGKIWDTQLAEYILTGQQHKYPALREIAVLKYACKSREKRMEAYWEKGIDTDQIPVELVIEDVTQDVLDTEQIYLQQYKDAKKQNMLELIELQMDALLATTEIEYNGLFVNAKVLENNKQILEKELHTTKVNLDIFILQYWKNPTVTFNCDSNDHLSLLFFGGKIKTDKKEPIIDEAGAFVYIKTGVNKGQLKLKKITELVLYKGLEIEPLTEWKTKKEGIYQTNEEVLQILKKVDNEQASKIATHILKIRELNKQLNTYYTATQGLIYPDHCIHASFVHVQTDTGRTSSKAPNIQNQPKSFESKVKEHFCSRFLNGELVEADFSQLEVAVEAQLSKDLIFMRDVINGVDFHIKRLALKEGISYSEIDKKIKIEKDPIWIEKRSKIKSFSFAKQYGAGPHKIAEESGMSVQEVKELIIKEEKEYPTLALYHKYLKQLVDKQGYYQSFTGRKYYFKKYPAPAWLRRKGVDENYKPTEIQNYMTQGTATADISMIMIGLFWRNIGQFNTDKYLMVNTVHDELLLDVQQQYIEDARKDLSYLENVGIMMNKLNYDWSLPIKVDIKTAKTWYQCGF